MLKTWHQNQQIEISFMIRLLLSAIVVCLSISANAQKKTYYYKLTKKVHNGTPSTNVSGGQFITFMSDICYESTKEGIGVGHGNLTRMSAISDNNFVTYMGGCYYGSESAYKFTRDLGTLNVVTQNGDVYLYKKSTPPSGVTTCSLIRKNTPSYSSSGENVGGGYTVMPSQHVYNGGGGTSTTTTTIRTTPERNTPTKVWHECGLCHGKRTIVRESSVSTFGNDTQWYCSQCGRNVWRSSGHSHVTCTQCGGQGGYYTTQYR